MNKILLIKLLKSLWVLASIGVLGMTLYGHYTAHSPEATLNGVITMIVLSMPSGLFVVLLLNIVALMIGTIFSIYIQDNYFTIIATWSLIFAAGYFQWFTLVAIIFQKLRRKYGSKISKG